MANIIVMLNLFQHNRLPDFVILKQVQDDDYVQDGARVKWSPLPRGNQFTMTKAFGAKDMLL
jgi:hypothetical protein